MSSDVVVKLGRANYRRSEGPYPGVGHLSAQVGVSAFASWLFLGVEVRKPELELRIADEWDPKLDNESPDIHSDGVQCYIERDGWRGYVAVPFAGSEGVSIRPVTGTTAEAGELKGTWRRTDEGYVMLLEFDMKRRLVSATV